MVFGVSARSDRNWPVQLQKMDISLKFRIKEEEELCYLCSKNKGADQLRSYCEADLHLCYCIGKNPVFSCSADIALGLCSKTGFFMVYLISFPCCS